MNLLLIGIGGSLGALCRFVISSRFNKGDSLFPFGTLLSNIIGSYILGYLFGLHMQNNIAEWIWLFFGIGFSGALTTFSTYSYELLDLLKQKKILKMALYISVSTCTSVALFALGLYN